MRTWGVRAALIGASVLVAATAIPAQASVGPLRVVRPVVHARHQLRGLVNHRDPSIRPQRSLVTPRSNSVAGVPRPLTVLPTTVVAGTWTSLGPQPIADEKAENGTNPTSDFGRASGRVTALVTDPTNASIVYAGTAGGGVWKSTDGGTNWATTPTMDGAPTLAIGALAIDAAGTTIYAATGEDNASSDSQYGQGLLKSTDSGQTWAVAGTSGNTNFLGGTHIGGIAVDRNTSGGAEHVLVASDAGLFSSPDSGATWVKVSPASLAFTAMPGKTASGQFIQVMQDAVGHFWAVATDFCQTEAGDIFTSADGSNWTNTYRLQPSGAPQAGRIALDVSHDGQIAIAALAGCANFGSLAGLERTNNGGASWSVSQAPNDYMSFTGTSPPQGQGWYDNVVAIDPTNANNFVLGGITAVVTNNGGISFSDVGQPYNGGTIHPDFHALAFTGAQTFYAGNDGGVWQTSNLGNSWTNRNGNLNTIQFYSGTALDSTHIAGGSQDNGTEGILPGSTATFPAWQHYLDGDGGATLVDPTTSTIYGTTPGGGIWQGSYSPPPPGSSDPQWPYDSFVEADPCPQGSTAPVCREPTAFVTPLLMDQTSPKRLLTATTTVYQSATGGVPAGSSWTAISPVLATATSPPNEFDNISTLVMGKTATKTVFAGSYFGALWMSRNTDAGAGSWSQINGNLPAFDQAQHVPGNPWISGIAFNEANPSEAWVTIGAVRITGAAGAGHVWHTTNAGANAGTIWTDVSGAVVAANVPSDLVVNGIVYDAGSQTIYIATDLGVLACATCAGNAVTTGTWATVGGGLPHVKVDAITEMQQNQIVAWTHGRGAWVVPVAPILDVKPTQLTFTVGPGGKAPGPQTITVGNDGVGTMSWTAASTQNSPNPAWLQPPNPVMGSDAAKESKPVVVPVNTAGVPAGTYQGTVTIATPTSGSASVAVTLIIPPFPGQYKPLVPYRVLNTRNRAVYPGGPLTSSSPIDVQIAGTTPQGGATPGVPPMNSATPPSAVVLNVTVTNETQPSHVIIWPTGSPRPTTSNLNFGPKQDLPNLVEVALGAGGKVSAFVNAGSTDIIFDVAGWVTTQGTAGGTDGRYTPVVPARIFHAVVGQQVPYHLQVAGAANSGIPPKGPGGPEGVVFNLTVVDSTYQGYVTVYPSDASLPDTSNINVLPHVTRANRVAVKLGADGAINIYNYGGNTEVIIDVNGWFSDASAPAGSAGQFSGLAPARILDTRFGIGRPAGPVGAATAIPLQVSGFGGVPAMTDPVTPTAVVLNVTAVDQTAAGHLRVYPNQPSPPDTSDMNWIAGETVPNLVVVKLSSDGKIGIYNCCGTTDVIVDVFGWYQ